MIESNKPPETARLGQELHDWARELFPICRSITGEGTRQTLRFLQGHLPAMTIESVPSGTPAFDWTVPDEWSIRAAYVEDASGRRIVDFADHNLHVVGYSEPVDRWIELEELEQHLHSLPDQPDAIPYVTSYYRRTWGFCLQHRRREQLRAGRYHVVIDSTLAPGVLNYGELILPGTEPTEILLSTYVCHPSMANNELSGPVVTAALGRWLASLEGRRHTYRILFLPETIGSLCYLGRHLDHMQRHCIAGFVLTCVGDDRTFSFVPSREGNTLADRVARHVLRHATAQFTAYTYLDRGSDERQYCSAKVNLPIASVMRSKYWCYPEYHTSLDDLALISPAGLAGSFEIYQKMLSVLESNWTLEATVPGEPFLQKHQLFSISGSVKPHEQTRLILNVLAYADGRQDLISLAEAIDVSALDCIPVIAQLRQAGLLRSAQGPGRGHGGAVTGGRADHRDDVSGQQKRVTV